MSDDKSTMLPEAEFVARFHAIGKEHYHHQHPFHLLMHEGKLTRGQLQAWALNRYYYQSRIPDQGRRDSGAHATIPRSASPGANASSTTMATARARAESRSG